MTDQSRAASWSRQLAGPKPQPIDRVLWTLAWYSYGQYLPYRNTPWDRESQPDLPAGWVRIADEVAAAGSASDPLKSKESGLRAMAFRDNAGHTVLAFRGTNDRRDWVSNTDQALGRGGEQYEQAMDLAVHAQQRLGDDLVFTGHSLGGGLAATATLATGLTSVTFDAAGLHDHTIAAASGRRGVDPALATDAAASGQIRAYHTSTDLLTTLQDNADIPMPPAVGRQISLPVNRSPARRGWRAAGLGLGAGAGAVVGGLVSGLNPAATRVGATAGALVGQSLGAGLYGHLYHAVDDGLAALFDTNAASPAAGSDPVGQDV